MEQPAGPEKGTIPPQKPGIRDFPKALLWTVVPFLAMAAAGALPSLALGNSWGGIVGLWIGLYWLVGPACVLGAIIAAILFRRNRSIMAGIFAGLGIGIVALGGSCFASVFIQAL